MKVAYVFKTYPKLFILFAMVVINLLSCINVEAAAEDDFFTAISSKDTSTMQNLLNNGIGPDIRNSITKIPALTACVYESNLNGAKLLLDHGANVDILWNNKQTPLKFAVMRNDIKMINLLLEYGANINNRDGNGFTPLSYAKQKGKVDIVDALLNNKPVVKEENQYEQQINIENSQPIEDFDINAKNYANNMNSNMNYSPLARIAIVLAGDQIILSEERNLSAIHEAIEMKFPKNKYTNVIEDKKVYQELLIIAEDRDISALDKLKRMDFVSAGKKFGYDYVIVLPFYSDGGYYTTSGWTNMVSQNVTVRARIVDVQNEEYLYRLDITEQGESGNAFGSPSLVRAQKEGIEKCLETIFADINIGEKIKTKTVKK